MKGLGYKRFTRYPQTDFSFLLQMGLKSSDVFLDIGCGGGRLGWQLINYLDVGRYNGFDKEADWVSYYVEQLKSCGLLASRHPVVSHAGFSSFEYPSGIDVAYAYSVLTHASPELADVLLGKIAEHGSESVRFFLTVLFADDTESCRVTTRHVRGGGEFAEVFYEPAFFREKVASFGFSIEDLPAAIGIGPSMASTIGDSYQTMVCLRRER